MASSLRLFSSKSGAKCIDTTHTTKYTQYVIQTLKSMNNMATKLSFQHGVVQRQWGMLANQRTVVDDWCSRLRVMMFESMTRAGTTNMTNVIHTMWGGWIDRQRGCFTNTKFNIIATTEATGAHKRWGQMDRWIKGRVGGWINGLTAGWMDRRINGWTTDRWVDWPDRWLADKMEGSTTNQIIKILKSNTSTWNKSPNSSQLFVVKTGLWTQM